MNARLVTALICATLCLSGCSAAAAASNTEVRTGTQVTTLSAEGWDHNIQTYCDDGNRIYQATGIGSFIVSWYDTTCDGNVDAAAFVSELAAIRKLHIVENPDGLDVIAFCHLRNRLYFLTGISGELRLYQDYEGCL